MQFRLGELFQRGLYEAKDGYGYGMLPGYVLRDGHLLKFSMKWSP